jgi:uncharacterized membrane protein
MKKIITLLLLFLVFVVLLVVPTFAQDNHTAIEEKEGKVIWEKLQAKQINCDTLTDGDYERLGEYYMGQMVGDSHESINTMMERMMGKEGEEQMHVVMGKRLSGCDTSAKGGVNSMMGFGNIMGWGSFGLLFSFFWIIILIDLILLGVFLWKKITKDKK